jgi:hypothetical protein
VNVCWARCSLWGDHVHGSNTWNRLATDLKVTPPKYRIDVSAVQQMLMDAWVSRGYLFHNACVTESCGVEEGPLPLLVSGAWGRNQIEARKVA